MSVPEFIHCVVFHVHEDDTPGIEWCVCEDIDSAYVHAAFAIKSNTPKGFVIVRRQGEELELIEKYVPSGGPERFSMVNHGYRAEVYFDNQQIT